MTALLVGQDLSSVVGARTLFSQVSFSLGEGQILAVTGPSGSGKTSLLRAVAGLGALSTGSVRLREHSQEALGPRHWRRAVALMPQEPPPLAGTMSEFAAQLARLEVYRGGERRAQLASRLWEHAEALGLSAEHLESPFAKLSGGERQRLYLSLVLATDPDVLLLDEPTSALDLAAKGRVEAILQGRTVLLVTHDAGQVERLGADSMVLAS